MVSYDSEFSYIESASTTVERIAKIDAIINALEATLLTAATSDHLSEYWLDDGQTKVKTVYRGVESITNGLKALDTLRQRYSNRVQGRIVTLADEKNFRGR